MPGGVFRWMVICWRFLDSTVRSPAITQWIFELLHVNARSLSFEALERSRKCVLAVTTSTSGGKALANQRG